ncbi:CarD family transcriptional regulator [Fusibacter bizertensis]|jgi:transcriptional regulator, CarD family|uniref:CarD family transcriptional regulator n=1 Tax=Fusibacter bizertensis TaxID=1488331 RepID=A0ABT6NHJ6_9FIRM|nr:CarD family transcriptional regulator [Fusibacter bizertensis]MDH8679891.1 CarD family transcriptional regulator [Fusibacter bizertensis]
MFKVGDKIVYPMHGAGVIEAIEFKELMGADKEFYILKLPIKNMKVMIPTANAENLGVRRVVDKGIFNDVMDILAQNKEVMPDNWNRRYRANLEKVKTGDIFEVATVVRNLEILDREKGLSTGERKMLNNSKQILISELTLSKDLKEEDVVSLVNSTIGSH